MFARSVLMIVYCIINRVSGKKNITNLYQFCRQWTAQIETETDFTWYCRLDLISADEFATAFSAKLKELSSSGTWGAGISKATAKLAAHIQPNSTIKPSKTHAFLADLPLKWLQIPETQQLNRLGIYTIGELAATSIKALTFQFGSRAKELVKLAMGKDIKPFMPDNHLDISWEINFLTNPEIAAPISRPQLDSFLAQGLAAIEQQLKLAKLTTAEIELQWNINEKTCVAIKKLNPTTYQQDVLQRVLNNSLPSYPIDRLKITVKDFLPQQAKQIGVFGENLAKQKIDCLKLQLNDFLIDLELSRREKVLLMWEQSYL